MRFKTAAATAFAVRATAGIAPSARAQMMEAVQACCNGGMVVAMGYVDSTLEIPSYDIVTRQTQVVGTRALTRIEFREIVQLVNFGTSVPDIGELVPISQVNEAFEKLRSGRYPTRAVLTLPFD